MASPVLNDRQFGILIAYVIPGFVIVNGLADHLPEVANWLAQGDKPTLGGFLYATLASITCGLLVSTVRWLVVDTLFHRTGIQRASWCLSQLQNQIPAFEMFVLYTYRYYQFHANCAVALPVWFILVALGERTIQAHWLVALIIAELVLLTGARDTLRKYYARTNEILNDQSQITTIILP